MDNEISSNLNSADPPIEVLLVDDEILNIRSLQRVLRNENYRMDFCTSGEDAVTMTKERSFDVVIMDIMMPGITGLEACRIIHQHKPELPIIIMTALIDDLVIKEAFESGAADYLRKPLNYTEVVVRINNSVGIRRANAKTNELYERLRNDVEAAAEIQKCLTTDRFICLPGMDCSSIYLPAETVSGDIFDIIPLEHQRSFFYVGDISGHGVQSAMLTAAVKTLIRMESERIDRDLDFSRISINIILQLGQLFQRKYMTFILGLFDQASGEIQYINCGHPPMFRYVAIDRKLRRIDGVGEMPIGWNIQGQLPIPTVNHVRLDDGDTLFCYTDGMFECVNAEGQMPGIEQLEANINTILTSLTNPLMLPPVLCNSLEHAGFQLNTDDCTMLAIRYKKTISPLQLLKVRSKLSEVGAVGKRCETVVLEWTQDTKLAAKCELAVVEFLNNIIIHGYPTGHKAEDIYLRIEYNTAVKLLFYDQGVVWEIPESATTPATGYELLAESGRGIEMIRTMASEFTRARYGNINETVITIEKKVNI